MGDILINITSEPLSSKRLGLIKSVKVPAGKPNEYWYYELCEITYRHPQAPNDAVVTQLDWVEVNPQLVHVNTTVDVLIKAMKEASALCPIKEY